MTFAGTIFPTMSAAASGRSRRHPAPKTWQSRDALSGFASPAAVLEAVFSSASPGERRPVLRALLALAPADAVARENLLTALVPALRAVAGELARWVPVADREEVDALVALGAWEAICALGGTEQLWPDRSLVGRARDDARVALYRQRRSRAHETASAYMAETVPTDDGTDAVVVADLVRGAMGRARLSRSATELIWQLRVEGRSPAQLADKTGRSTRAIAMERLRAERALRAAVA